MHIGLTDEQELLRDTTARLADQLATVDPDSVSTGEQLENEWRDVVALGVPALRAPEAGDLDASGVETAVVVEEFARRLCAVPVLGQAVLATELLHAAGADKEIELVSDGTLRLAPLLSPDLAGFAAQTDRGIAFDAAGSTHVLAAIEDDGNRRLVYAPIGAVTGVEVEHGGGLDLTRALVPVSTLDLDSTTPAGQPIDAQRWTKANALALTVVAADLVGVMAGALDDAVRYAGERVQFGVKIGSFQAIQHLLADALARLEGARSCLWHAAWAVDHLPPAEAMLAGRTAKAYSSAAGRDVVETAIQVLGGISITWEHLAHLRLRRTLLNRRLFGDESAHYQAIAQLRLADRDLG